MHLWWSIGGWRFTNSQLAIVRYLIAARLFSSSYIVVSINFIYFNSSLGRGLYLH